MNYIFLLGEKTILDVSKKASVGQFFQAVLSFVFLLIDSVVYYITSVAFKLFLAISQFELFNDATFSDLISRTYIVIGVVSIFLVAYALINAIINPDNFSKGDKSITKIVKNLVISIIAIALIPTIFNYFYYFQKVILCNNTIPKLFLNTIDGNDFKADDMSKEFSALIFESFFYPNAASGANDNDTLTLEEAQKAVNSKEDDPFDGKHLTDEEKLTYTAGNYTLYNAFENAKGGESFYLSFSPFLFGENSIRDNTVQYLIILSTIAGGYVAYVLINLCFDMGTRAVKLGYLELIAPLAIMTTIIPGKDSVFKNWLKKTTSCAFEVFTRLFVVIFAIYLINTIKDMDLLAFGSTVCGLKLGRISCLLLRAIIICAIFGFVKKSPDFFKEATGIKSDGFKIGLLDKMKENGMAQGLGAAGAFATTGSRKLFAGFRTGGIAGAIGGGLKSIPQSLSAGRKGWANAKDVKKWSDVKSSASNAADETEKKHLEWEDYKKTHNGFFGGVRGKISDTGEDIKDYWTQSHQANYAHESDKHQKLEKIISADNDINNKAKEIMDRHAHEIEIEIETKGGKVTKSLKNFRKDEDQAKQALSAALNAKAMADVNGTIAEKQAAADAVTDARNKFNDAQDAVTKAEKAIKTRIKKGDNTLAPDKIKAAEFKELESLYTQYQTVLKDNLGAITDKDTHTDLQSIANESASEFRARVIDSEENHSIRVPGYPNQSVADAVKYNSAAAAGEMNKESEAIRKKEEGKK